jgi:hypothetical protein
LYLATALDARLQFFLTSVSGVVYTTSVFVKNIDAGVFRIDMANVAVGPVFNFLTKTFTTVSGWATGYQEFANGWFRLYASRQTTTTLASPQFSLDNSASGSVFIYGAQYELGSYPTSYIPTLGSSVTRLADAASKTGISSLIGQTEGTIFIEASNKILGQSDRFLFAVNDDAFNNVIFLNYTSAVADSIRFFVIANGETGALAFKSVIDPVLKAVVTYKNGVYKLFYNGEIQHTQSGNSFSANLENIFLGCSAASTQQIGEGIKPIIFYPTALSDAEAIELTTL